LSRLRVFKSREVLLHDYTPPRLPHRERQLEELWNYFRPVLEEGVTARVHVHGEIGTGKTVLCKRFGRDLEAEAAKTGKKLKYVYINLAHTPRPYQVMTELLEKLCPVESPRSGLSPEETLLTVAQALSREDLRLVLILDEVDTYLHEGRSPRIFYTFGRVRELYEDPVPRLSLIYVSRCFEWMKRLDGPTLDTLGRVSAVHLHQYGLPEVRDILQYRAEEAFQPGAVPEAVISFIADVAVSWGGVRYGLELLLEAGGQAELDRARSVGAEHVRRAHASIPKGVNGAFYPGELSLHKQLLLLGVVEALRATAEPYVPVGEVYEGYRLVCGENGREAEEEPAIRSYLKDLFTEGYVLLSDGGARVGTEFPADRMARALEMTLKHTVQASEEP